MRLTKLKLAGFKTFVDPTTVLTPGNLVGVVGPNGCGKSNIIDAVRWVLGETRASALRGESMQDVIFNGSTTRKPVSRASVELVFDNAEGRAAGQWTRYAEISVKRVLDRSGESSYHINNVHVRRKDVVDLFLGTGLGPRAYAIIEQGMISRIIEAKPEEIRGFLEEAAGVTKYRERRRETEGRLSDARDNLTRLDDIRNELVERIAHLATQAEVATRYRDLNAAHVQRQQLLWLLKREEARHEQQTLATELNQLSARMESDSARLQALESEVEAVREAHFASSEHTHEAQSALYAASAEVSRLEGELRHLDDARARLEKRLLELAAEQQHWAGRQQAQRHDQQRWQTLLDNARMRVERSDARHAEVALQLPESEGAHHAANSTVAAARRELGQTEQQLRVEEANRTSATRALDALGQRRARLEGERGQIDGPEPVRVAEAERKVEALEAALLTKREELVALQARLPDAQHTLKGALENEKQRQRRLTELRARRDALMQLQSRVQSQGKLGDWLRRHRLDALVPLWQGLRVESGWELAVETMLQDRVSALTGDVSSAVQAVFEAAPPESVSIAFGDVPADSSGVPVPAPAGATPLLDRISITDAALRPVLQGWLAECFVVDRLEDWIDRRMELACGVTLVDARGRVLARHMLGHYAPDSRTHGVMERQREIETLGSELLVTERDAQLAHDALVSAEARAAELNDRANALRRELQNDQQYLHGEQVTLLKLTQARQRAQEKSEQIERDLSDLVHLESTEREHLARADMELARCAELGELQHDRLNAALDILAERERVLKETGALEQASARELQEARFSERECAGKLDDIARNLQLALEQLDRIAREITLREQELTATDSSRSASALQQALGVRQSRETALAACRDAQEQAAARLKQIEEMRLRTEQEAAPARVRVGELRLAVQAAEMATAQYAERLAEAEADEAALMPLLSPDLREATLQREVTRLAREIADLGQVNLAALDELRTAQQRKAYLDAQNDDLSEAIGTLEDAIRRIDRETREQLQETYDTVTRHFGQLFPQLFGGGQARLVLTGDEILDAGIQIVAQPPGKKNASIHLLSGGEKALTAIALVFSMFQLNPAPFCMLDEVDAPLDDANTERYCQMVKRMASQTQFVFISHSKVTMEIAQQLVGVTMQEQGVSRVVEVDIEEALRLAEAVEA
ncbi:chromosome segregation protein SMC [Rhodocyclaceae bacterium SMB388]